MVFQGCRFGIEGVNHVDFYSIYLNGKFLPFSLSRVHDTWLDLNVLLPGQKVGRPTFFTVRSGEGEARITLFGKFVQDKFLTRNTFFTRCTSSSSFSWTSLSSPISISSLQNGRSISEPTPQTGRQHQARERSTLHDSKSSVFISVTFFHARAVYTYLEMKFLSQEQHRLLGPVLRKFDNTPKRSIYQD